MRIPSRTAARSPRVVPSAAPRRPPAQYLPPRPIRLRQGGTEPGREGRLERVQVRHRSGAGDPGYVAVRADQDGIQIGAGRPGTDEVDPVAPTHEKTAESLQANEIEHNRTALIQKFVDAAV